MKKLEELHNAMIRDPESKDKRKDFENTNNEIKGIIAEKTKGAMFCTHMQWHNEGERSMKYYFALERANYLAKTMTGVRLENNTITRNSLKILKGQAKFYKKLFKKDSNVAFTLTNDSGTLVTQQDRETLEQPFTIEELHKAFSRYELRAVTRV